MIGKQIDEQTPTIISIEDIFTTTFQHLRDQLTNQSEILIFENHEFIGKRSREFLWRKGYYEIITIAKRIRPKVLSQCNEARLINLIFEGIKKFKSIILNFENKYNLDLKYIIDFELLNPDLCHIEKKGTTEKYKESTINYALETVHSLLVSIGDLHRYYIDFKFNSCTPIVNRDIAAKYYYEAFKLNSKIGMPQNQLGTLYSGCNYNFDSMYHYLYSLVCRQPFDLSENNAIKIFQINSEHLESINNGINLKFNIQDFLAQFILIVDIFFYDKNVTDFNMLCHSVLIDFRNLLKSNEIQLNENDFFFKFVSILLFCLAKLRIADSLKIHSLNAFLMAICSELIDSCTTKLEQFIVQREQQSENFKISYSQIFGEYDNNVRLSKNILRKCNNKSNTKPNKENLTEIEETEFLKNSEKSENAMPLNKTMHQSQNSTISNDGNNLINGINKETTVLSDNIKSVHLKTKKLPNKIRRRRKKISLYNSDSDLSSYTENTENNVRDNPTNFDRVSDLTSEDYYESFGSSHESSDVDYDSDRKLSQIEMEHNNDAKV